MNDTLVGIRNEVAFEQLLIELGINYKLGDVALEKEGGDVTIQNIHFDLKATQKQADVARIAAIRHKRNPALIIWSHIHFNDFDDELTIPYERIPSIAKKALPDIEAGLASEGVRLQVAA